MPAICWQEKHILVYDIFPFCHSFWKTDYRHDRMSGLTEEQRRRMEENRQKALAKRAEAKAKSAPGATWAASTSLIGPIQGITGPASNSLARPPIRPATSSSQQNTFTSGDSSGFGSKPTPSGGGTFSKPAPSHSSTIGSPVKSVASSSMIRPATSGSQQSKLGNSNFNNNNKAPPGGNFNKPIQHHPNTARNAGSNISFAIGKPPQNVPHSAPTSANPNTWNKQPQTKTFYASNPTSGNANRAQGTWTNRPGSGSGSGNATGTTSGQYRPQNQGGQFQRKGSSDKNQNHSRFSSQKQSANTAGASPTKLVNQLFDDAGKSAAKTKGSCGLISRTRFEVNVMYHAKLIEVFKSMSTRQYNSDNRRWSFHVREYEALMNKIGDVRSEVHLEPLPRSVLQVLC